MFVNWNIRFSLYVSMAYNVKVFTMYSTFEFFSSWSLHSIRSIFYKNDWFRNISQYIFSFQNNVDFFYIQYLRPIHITRLLKCRSVIELSHSRMFDWIFINLFALRFYVFVLLQNNTFSHVNSKISFSHKEVHKIYIRVLVHYTVRLYLCYFWDFTFMYKEIMILLFMNILSSGFDDFLNILLMKKK